MMETISRRAFLLSPEGVRGPQHASNIFARVMTARFSFNGNPAVQLLHPTEEIHPAVVHYLFALRKSVPRLEKRVSKNTLSAN